MTTTLQLRPALARLKMSGILETLDERMRYAGEKKLSYGEFLFSIMQDEIQRRDNQALALRLKRSNLDPTKTRETFDLDINPKLPQALVKDLYACNFINNAENLIIAGLTGTGKSHLAQAIGHEACRKGYDVRFDRADDMLAFLNSGRADDSYQRKLKYLRELPLLIIDDFGLTELNTCQQMDFYEIICRRYERKSTIITSNRDVNEWFSLFQNALVASAAIDRLMHRGIKLIIEGDSYRFKHSIQLNKKYQLTESKKE